MPKIKVVQILGRPMRSKKNANAGMVKALVQFSCGDVGVFMIYDQEFNRVSAIKANDTLRLSFQELAFIEGE